MLSLVKHEKSFITAGLVLLGNADLCEPEGVTENSVLFIPLQ